MLKKKGDGQFGCLMLEQLRMNLPTMQSEKGKLLTWFAELDYRSPQAEVQIHQPQLRST